MYSLRTRPFLPAMTNFLLWLIDKYFSLVFAELGMTRDQFIDLGRQSQPWGDMFVMPVLALKLSERANAVSELHGIVSRAYVEFPLARRKGRECAHRICDQWRAYQLLACPPHGCALLRIPRQQTGWTILMTLLCGEKVINHSR